MGIFLSNKYFETSGSVSVGAGVVRIVDGSVVGSTVTEDVSGVSGVESAESTPVQDVSIKAADATTINTSKISRFIS
jgi:hypothetical protein